MTYSPEISSRPSRLDLKLPRISPPEAPRRVCLNFQQDRPAQSQRMASAAVLPLVEIRPMKTPLSIAIEAVCRLANLEPERTARILTAAAADRKPVVEKLLNIRQAAAMLGCHPKTLLGYGQSGRLHPVRRSSRLIRWRQSEIEKMLMGEI